MPGRLKLAFFVATSLPKIAVAGTGASIRKVEETNFAV